MTAGAVYYKKLRDGTLRKTADGFEFSYDDDYLTNPDAAPISLSIPLRKKKYASQELFPFFDGLLPEGWLLHLTSQISKIDENDKFNLLLLTGEDPIGAVSIRPLEDDHG